MSDGRVHHAFSQLWEETLGDERICIAVLDGPVDRSHHAFKGAKLRDVAGSYAATEASEGFASQHGTHIASVIFGQHGSSVKGIAPLCSGLLIPIFGNSTDGNAIRCSQIDLARAITAAVELGANIINISGGEFTSSGSAHPILGDVLNRCDQDAILIVAAAGNEGCDCLHIPAAHPSILVVGAASQDGNPLESSNWGTQYREHGLLAEGENIKGAGPNGSVVERSGTSAATAIVSGVAGLLMSLQIERGTTPRGPGIRQLLLNSADPCDEQKQTECHRYLSGLLNVESATSMIKKGDHQMAQNQSRLQSKTTADAEEQTPRNLTSAIQAQLEESIPSQLNLAESVPDAPNRTTTASPGQLPTSQISPSACSCGGGTPAAPQLVFALGQLGFAFSSEARIDSFRQHMYDLKENPSPNPHDAQQLLDYLKENPWDSSSIIWTLNFDLTPIYAISVAGPYAIHISNKLQDFLADQIAGKVERVSIPGLTGGRARLITGEELPIIYPEIRGMYSWDTSSLVVAVAGEPPANNASKESKQQFQSKTEGLRNFLDRVYYELRNLGQTSRERAINYSATNAFEIERIYETAVKEQMELKSISAEPSPHGRIGSDCWDVILTFFYPKRENQTVKRAFRFTVDVSDVVPVTVGPMRDWSITE